jgi:hypothetical protein
MVVKLLGAPFVILKLVRGTATMVCTPLPDHFEQSLQWQRAFSAGAPGRWLVLGVLMGKIFAEFQRIVWIDRGVSLPENS